MTKPSQSASDYYEILDIPFTDSSASLSSRSIKGAYHKALLKHHPDKAGAVKQQQRVQVSSTAAHIPPSTPYNDVRTYTIDEITTAYKTLLDPQQRAEYDRSLRLDRRTTAQTTGDVFHTGLEIVDLEDLACDEGDGSTEPAVWYRGCRCGDERGFEVTEDDLEMEAEHGEIVIGCRGCSLWLKILFAVEDA